MKHKSLTMLILALLAAMTAQGEVSAKKKTATKNQYNTYIWKADSLFLCGEFDKASAMFDKAFQIEQYVEGRHLYNAACVAAMAGLTDVAFERLTARMKKEPNWYSNNYEHDDDLASLHGDPRWKAFADTMSVRQARVESHYDKPLRQRLHQIGESDQNIRHQFIQARNSKPRNQAKIDSLDREMHRIDSLNQAEICDILDKRGFVSSQIVGEACQVFWLIIQHAPVELERKYLSEFQKAAARGEIPPSHVAMMEDRINMFEDKPQKYGSQLTEGPGGGMVLYKLLDPEKVDVWRKEVGMEPLSDYLKAMGARMPAVPAPKVTDEVLRAQRPFLQQGDSCMQQYNTFEALKYYQEALNKADTYVARTKLADCYYKRGNYRQTSDLLKLVPEDSLSHEAFRQLCYSYQKQGDNDSFVWWTSSLTSHYPMDGEMIAGLITALTRENQAWKGIDIGESYFNKDSTNLLVNRALADAYFIGRRFDDAVTMYERLLHQGDSTFNTLYSAGMSYTRIDSLNQAYKCLLPALHLSQLQHAGCAYRLGVVCNDLRSFDEGLACLDLALKLMQPDTTTMKAITLSQGEAYYLTKQYDKAVETWKQHLAYNPTSIATYYNIANAYYFFLSDTQQAMSYFEQFIQAARREQNPNAQLTEMISKAEELLKKRK